MALKKAREIMLINARTPKEHVRALVERMPDDVTMEQVFYKLEFFISVFTGVLQAERGEGIDHDELFDQLLSEYEDKENNVARSSKKRSSAHSASDRGGLPKNRSKLRKSVKEVRK